jgi:hypothetical protein
MTRKLLISAALTFSILTAITGPVHSEPLEQNNPVLARPLPTADRSQRFQNILAGAIRHELVTLPYYDVFDWLEVEVASDGQVKLQGEVVRPTTSDDAARRVQKIEGVSGLMNQIKILPVSVTDNELRVRLYRAIYDWNYSATRCALCRRFTSSSRIVE